jgi:hypothetical protein
MTESRDAPFGADVPRLQTSRGSAWVLSSAQSIPADLRRSAFAERSKDLRYYEVLEGNFERTVRLPVFRAARRSLG